MIVGKRKIGVGSIGLVMLVFSSVHSQERAFSLRWEAGSDLTYVRFIDTRISFGYAILPNLELEGGLAWSIGIEADFIQIQLGPRLVLGNGLHRFVSSAKFFLGFNQAILPKHTGSDSGNHMEGTPVFLDLALVGYELRFYCGWTLTASTGLSILLGGGRFWDNEGAEYGSPGSIGFLLHAGLGYRF